MKTPLPAVVFALASAAAATAHEVVWARTLGKLVGNTAWAIALTLACFMIGMGLGSLFAQRLAARAPFRRAPYAVAELGIAITAALAHAAILLGPLPSAVLGTDALALDVTVASLLVTLPALLIGATYPLLLGSLPRPCPPSAVTWLYVAGLAGGVTGTLATAAWIVPLWGLGAAAGVACVINLGVGIAASSLRPQASAGHRALPRPLLQKGQSLLQHAALFGAAGAVGLGAQVVWNRVLAPYAGVSTFTFAAIVAVYLVAQVAGASAFRARQWPDVVGTWALVAAVPAIAGLLLLAPALAEIIPHRTSAGALSFALACVVVVAGSVLVPAGLIGISQAAALRRVEREETELEARAGLVVGLGTIASAAAALLVGLALFPAIGAFATLMALGVPAVIVVARDGARIPAGVGAALLVAIALFRPPEEALLGPGFDDAEIVSFDQGIQDTTAVIRLDSGLEPDVLRIVTDGVSYSGDSIFAQRYMRLLGHLPALAARERARAAVICIGTGTTLDAIARHDFERIDAIDISPTVVATLEDFAHVNGNVADDPRVEIILADGYRHLRITEARYDVVTLEPPPPRAPGGSTLYSVELYEAARDRLAEGGVVAQWIPLHGLTGWEIDTLVAAFLEVFPHATLHLAERNEAILLGGVDAFGAHATEEARVREDLAAIGFAGTDPFAETLWADAAALRRAATGTDATRLAWPAPELFPFSGPGAPRSIDAWLDEIARARNAAPGTFAATVGPAVPAFVRVLEGGGDRNDRARVAEALIANLGRTPDDPYAQFMLGYGALLEARIARAGGDPGRLERLGAQRAWAEEALAAGR